MKFPPTAITHSLLSHSRVKNVLNCYKLYKELKEAFEDTAVEERSTSSSTASARK